MPAHRRRAVIYARLSHGDLSDRIESQTNRCRKYCEENEIDVVAVLAEDDASASRYAMRQRPKYQEMIRMIESGEADTICAWNLDRLWRQPSELEHLIDLADRGEAQVVTLAGRYDLTTSEDRMNARLLVVVAAKESDDKSRRTRAKHEDIAMAGRWAGGTKPYGYRPAKDSPGGLILDDEEAETVRWFVDEVLAGEPLHRLAARANDRGIPAPRGGRWTLQSIRGIITSDRIAARRIHIPGQHGRPRRGGEIYNAYWPQIITPDELSQVRQVLAVRGGRRSPDGWRRYLLTGGLAICGECGAPLIAARGQKQRTGEPGTPKYICPTQSRGGNGCVSAVADRLEDTVAMMAWAVAHEIRPTRPAETESSTVETTDGVTDQAMLNDLMERFVAKEITAEEWQLARGALTRRMADVARRSRADPLADYREAGSLESAWPDLSIANKRVILDAMLVSVAVRKATRRGRVWDPHRVDPMWRI